MAQSEGVWSQPWHKPQNDPVPKRWLSTVDAIRLGCREPNVTMGLTPLAAGKGGHNLTIPALRGGVPHADQSGVHQAIPVLYQDC